MAVATERFWRQVHRSEGCWEWTGGKLSNGYGRFWCEGRTIGAHVFSWRLHVGAVPDGHFVCHHCDNPPCVNPVHLFTAPPRGNSGDMVTKGRWAGNHQGVLGERNGGAKLNESAVVEMRRRWVNGATSSELAEVFGVTRRAAWLAATGRTWQAVPD